MAFDDEGAAGDFAQVLTEDGILWAQMDDQEVHYCKVILDEIFGRSNFISTVIWHKKHTSSNDARFISDNHDHILMFVKNAEAFKMNLLPRTDIHDSRYKNPDNDPRGPWASGPIQVKTPSEKDIYEIRTPSGRKVWPPKGTSWRVSKEKFKEMVKDNRIWFGESGKNIPRTKRFLTEVREGIIPKTIWLRDEVGDNQEGKSEIKAHFPDEPFRTPKPERLIERVIQLSTSQGDWVLDSFLGSGTTAAVAHKLGRKWIGIEIGEHAETLCLPRLTRVASGKDQTGISKQVGWKGGSGFRYCVLGESLFQKDADTGLVMINPHYSNGLLVQAVCNLEDFRLHNDGVLHGIRGNAYAHITEEKVTQVYLDALVEQLPEDKSLTIYCLKRSNGLQLPERLKIKRIPNELRIPRYITALQNGAEQ